MYLLSIIGSQNGCNFIHFIYLFISWLGLLHRCSFYTLYLLMLTNFITKKGVLNTWHHQKFGILLVRIGITLYSYSCKLSKKIMPKAYIHIGNKTEHFFQLFGACQGESYVSRYLGNTEPCLYPMSLKNILVIKRLLNSNKHIQSRF